MKRNVPSTPIKPSVPVLVMPGGQQEEEPNNTCNLHRTKQTFPCSIPPVPLIGVKQ